MFYIWKPNSVLSLSHCLVNIDTTHIEKKIVSMLFSQFRSNVNKHKLTQHSFSTKYRHWNNFGLSTLNQRNFFNTVSRFCQYWNSFDKIHRLNFDFQPNINVETFDRRRWIDVTLSTLFQRSFANFETVSINVCRLNFHFQPKIKVEIKLIDVD